MSGRQDGDDDDEDWAEETTEEAQRRRMEEISDHAKNLTLSEDLEKPLEERVNMFYNFVKVRVPRRNRRIPAILRLTLLISASSKGRRTEPSTEPIRRSWRRRSVWM